MAEGNPTVEVEIWVKVGDRENERVLIASSNSPLVPLPPNLQHQSVHEKVRDLLVGSAEPVAQKFIGWEDNH